MITAIKAYPGLFSRSGLRAGDLLALCNFLEFIRDKENKPELKFLVPDGSLCKSDHIFKMRCWLENYTDYIITDESRCDKLLFLPVLAGTDPTSKYRYDLWNIRKDVVKRQQNVFDIPDAVKITRRNSVIKNKVVICPIFDAAYNVNRNWPTFFLKNAINMYRSLGREIVVICKREYLPNEIDYSGVSLCDDYYEALQHLQECSYYVGGDTGFSHFVSALKPVPLCWYYYPTTTVGTTLPFYWLRNLNTFTYLYNPGAKETDGHILVDPQKIIEQIEANSI